MSTHTAETNRQGVLLEAGTNELEVLVFGLGKTRYGVNVAKVREVIGQVRVVRVPQTHPAVVGVFKLRDDIISLVDLQLYFRPGQPSQAEQRSVILMEFNEIRVGFLVDTVDRIYRLGWEHIKPMPAVQESSTGGVINSICEIESGLVLMVDFEKIAFDVGGSKTAVGNLEGVARSGDVDRSGEHVLLAEDSATVRAGIMSVLREAGYQSVVATSNGQQAWQTLQGTIQDAAAKQFTLVITDIEMPQMDGLHLCRRIKEHPQLKLLPVVVFSSLVSEDNLKKCKAVGANAAITKPQIARVVDLLDQLVARGPAGQRQTELIVIGEPVTTEPSPEPALV